MLEQIVKETSPFDKLDLLSKIAALQLLPANADHAMPLDAIAHAVASQKYLLHQPEISLKRLKQICNSPFITNGPIGLSEDPSEQMFTEAFTFEGGSYVVFPGIVDDATYILRNLAKAIFLVRESPFPQEFIQQSRILTTAILKLSDIIASKAGIKRGIDPVNSRDVVVPPNAVLQKLKKSVIFDTGDLARYPLFGHSLLDALQPFIANCGDIEADKYDLHNGLLHLKPLIRIDNEIVVSEPGVLLATLRHHLILEAIKQNLSKELAKQYRLAVWENVIEMLDYLEIKLRQSHAPNDGDPYLEGLFVLDRDKALYVQLVTDDLSDYASDTVFGDWQAQKFCDPLHKLSNNTEIELFTQGQGLNEVVDLVLLQSLGRGVTMSFLDRSVLYGKAWLALSASELETIAFAEGGDPLVLLKYARSWSKIRNKAEIFSVEQLNEFQIYRKHHYSYYISDEKFPNFLLIPPGFAGEIRREVSHQRDRHGAPSYEHGYVVEVTCRYGKDIPIYIPIQKIGGRATDLVEITPLNIWVIGPNYDKRDERRLHSKYVGFVDMIAYWLWQCAPVVTEALSPLQHKEIPVIIELNLTPHDKWLDVTDELLKQPIQDINSSISTIIEKKERRIVLTLYPEILRTMAGSDNSGERHVMKAVFNSLHMLIQETTHESSSLIKLTKINRTLESLMPISSKKMMIISHSHTIPELDPLGILNFRAVKQHDEQAVLDSIGEHLSSRGWKSGPIKDDDRVEFINNEVVSFLYESLTNLIDTLKFKELINWLISYNEATIVRLFETRLTIPTRLACFFENKSFVETLSKELPEINKAAIAVRFLIEYTIARPPNGLRPMSLEVYDQLLALASEIINWGFESDSARYNISDIKLSILPSGRVGTIRDDFLRARSSFLQEYTTEEISRANRAFSRYVTRTDVSLEKADIESLSKDAAIKELDEASLAEFELKFSEFGHLIGDIYNIGEEHPGPVKEFPLTDLIDRLSSSLRWAKGKVSKALGLLTLSPRPDFLVPQEPYAKTDVYPWRFNRALSYIRRPLLKVVNESGDILLWGNRHLYHSHGYILDLIISGKIIAQSEKMRELIGKFNRERGETFNDDVADLFEARPVLAVRRRIKKIGKKYVRGKLGDLGDIDVLVVDGHNHKIFVIECKDLAMARTPYELKGELDSIFKGAGGEKSTVEKHQLRTKWVKDNLESILSELDIVSTSSWEIEPLLVVDEALYSSHLYKSPIQVISYRQLAEEILPAWDKTKGWSFI